MKVTITIEDARPMPGAYIDAGEIEQALKRRRRQIEKDIFDDRRKGTPVTASELMLDRWREYLKRGTSKGWSIEGPHQPTCFR